MGSGRSVSACLALVTWAFVSQETNVYETPQHPLWLFQDQSFARFFDNLFGHGVQMVDL